MDKSTFFVFGVIIGIVIAIWVCLAQFNPILLCASAVTKGYSLVWDKEGYEGWCKVKTTLDGNIVLMEVKDYEKLLK